MLLALALIASAVVWLAPAEATMGDGIKPVYVHVALIWTGMVGLLIVSVLGLAVAIWNHKTFDDWLKVVGWVTLGFMLASLIASFAAQLVNWNGIFLDEPRMQISMRVLAAFLIVQVAGRWLPWPRLRGLVMALTAVIALISMRLSPLVLHPGDPISTASSVGIQATFVVLFILCLLAAVVMVWYWRGRQAGLA